MATSTAQAIATVPVYDWLMATGDPLNATPKGLPGKKVTIQLTYSLSQSASPVTLLGTDPVVLQTDPNGFWQANLVPNNKVSPTGTLYKVEIEGYRSYLVNVTDVGAPAIGWQSSAIAVLPPVGGGAPGYTLPGGTTVLGALTVQGLLDQQGLSQFDLRSTFAQGPVIDITHPNYGAKGDCRWVTDAAIAINTPNLTSATAAFSAADVGKAVLVANAGASGFELSTTILSVQSATACTLALNATATVSGKNACLGTDNALPIQKAIGYQQTQGGRIRVPYDSFGGNYLIQNPGRGAGILPGPGSWAGGFTDATLTCFMEGDGQNVRLIAGTNWGFDGLIGYQSGAKRAQVVLSDITLDGNYLGVAGGVISQRPAGPASALVSHPWPFTDPATTTYNGQYHNFWRVRFYRPTGFGTQPTKGIKFVACDFDSMGQPDAAIHQDNIGSDQGDA